MVKARILAYFFLSFLGILISGDIINSNKIEKTKVRRDIASNPVSSIDCLVHRLEKVTKRNSQKKLEAVLSLFKGQKGFDSEELLKLAEEIAKRCSK